MKEYACTDISKSWQQRYFELREFISEHPQVNISKSIVQIPAGIRPDFYRLFNQVRTTFIREMFTDLMCESSLLVKNYTQVEKDLTELLKLKSISAPHYFHEFLQSPAEELTRGLFDTLFDLLQEKINFSRFEEKAAQDIQSFFYSLSRSVYGKWVTLSLMKLLEANKLFQMNTRRFTLNDLWKRGFTAVKDIPVPSESSDLRFNAYSTDDLFIVPDVIFYSALLKKYVSFRSKIGIPLGTAANASIKREWYPFDALRNRVHGLTLVYLADTPGEISLVADIKRICRPDLILECRVQKDRHETASLENIEICSARLKPLLGTYIVSRDTAPQSKQGKKPRGIHILYAGLEQPRLKTIVNVLAERKTISDCDDIDKRSDVNPATQGKVLKETRKI
jgi:hypothetical protein